MTDVPRNLVRRPDLPTLRRFLCMFVLGSARLTVDLIGALVPPSPPDIPTSDWTDGNP